MTKEKRRAYNALLAAGIPALIGLALTLGIVFAAEVQRTESLIQAYAESITHGISSFFIDATAVASSAASLRSAQELDWEVAGMDFAGFVRSNRFIHRISLIDSEGYIYDAYEAGPYGNRWQEGRRTMDNSDPDAEPVIVTERGYFQTLVAENTRGEFSVKISEPFVPGGLTEKAFVTSAPIINGVKAVGAVSVAQTALELSHLYEDIAIDFFDKFGDKAHMYLVSHGEQLISDLEYNETYGAYMDQLFGRLDPVSVYELGEDTVTVIDAAVRNEKNVISANMHGESHFVIGVRIEGTPFAVCLAVLKSQMLYASRYILIVGIASFVLAALAGLIFMTKAIAKDAEGGSKDDSSPRRAKRSARIDLGQDDQFAAPVLPPDQG